MHFYPLTLAGHLHAKLSSNTPVSHYHNHSHHREQAVLTSTPRLEETMNHKSYMPSKNLSQLHVSPFSATRRDSRHQNKVKVKGLDRNSSHLAGFSFFFHGSMKKFRVESLECSLAGHQFLLFRATLFKKV